MMKKLNLFLILTLFGFGFGIAAETAYAVDPLVAAPSMVARHPVTHATSSLRLKPKNMGVSHNARLAFAPYAQVVPSNSYTFVGISHPSLATAHTTIGLVVEAMGMTFKTVQAGSGITIPMQRAVAFTINAGETHRVFIVNDSHPDINSLNPAINNTNTHLILTKDEPQFGSIRVTSVGTEPNNKTSGLMRGGAYQDPFALANTGGVHRFDNLNQLSMWGVVYQESNGAGFSLEFIGDMHDSSAAGTQTFRDAAYHLVAGGERDPSIHPHLSRGIAAITTNAGVGRGVN